MLKIGIAGLGSMGRNHLRVASGLEGVEIGALYDPPLVGKEFNGVVVTDQIDKFMSNIDYCVIATPTIFHRELALAAAKYKVHALIEKPIAYTTEEAQEIIDAFADANLIGAVGHLERYNPAIIALKERIDQVGDIYQISTSRQGPYPARIADVGVAKDLATHDFDLTMHLSGSNFREIQGSLSYLSGTGNEDLMVAVGKLENEIVTNHVINFVSPFKERKTVVLGSHGMLVADTLNVDTFLYENASVKNDWEEIEFFKGVAEGNAIKFAIPRSEPLRIEHEYFRDAILSGDDSNLVRLHHGQKALETAELFLRIAN